MQAAPSARDGRSVRPADEHASAALLEKTRFDEVLKHDPAHLLVEARHQRGVSGGELHALCLHEQKLDTGERFLETPRRGAASCISLQGLATWPPLNETDRECR